MTELRRRMDEAMIVRGFAARTRETYLDVVTGLAKYYRRSPDLITDAEVQAYVLYLLTGISQEIRRLSQHNGESHLCQTRCRLLPSMGFWRRWHRRTSAIGWSAYRDVCARTNSASAPSATRAACAAAAVGRSRKSWAVARRFLLPEAEMIVGDLARTEGGGRWATFAAPLPSAARDNGGSRLRQPKLVAGPDQGSVTGP
jgi:hypothetical protein